MAFVLESLSYVGWVLLAIMILVFVHELGHFLFAKLFKMRVEKFSVGFPPKIIGKKIGETEYVLGLTPLGGYVKISGMVDESMDTDQLALPPEPWEFRAKPVWQRMIVITAGVVFNMILAAIVFISLNTIYGYQSVIPVGPVVVDDGSIAYEMGMRTADVIRSVNGVSEDANARLTKLDELLVADRFKIEVERDGEVLALVGPEDIMTRLNRAEGSLGVRHDPTVVGGIIAGSGAELVGMRRGDRIEAIDDTSIMFFTDMQALVHGSNGEPLTIKWRRPDSLASVVPRDAVRIAGDAGPGILYESEITPVLKEEVYLIGVDKFFNFRTYSPVEAIGAGISDTWTHTTLIATSLKRLFTGRDNFRENIGGPIMIAKVTKDAADRGAFYFWTIVAMLSITLAIINILPIPALDGGHLVFLIYEGIARREPSLKLRMILQQVGMVLLFAFMAFVIFNDILKL